MNFFADAGVDTSHFISTPLVTRSRAPTGDLRVHIACRCLQPAVSRSRSCKATIYIDDDACLSLSSFMTFRRSSPSRTVSTPKLLSSDGLSATRRTQCPSFESKLKPTAALPHAFRPKASTTIALASTTALRSWKPLPSTHVDICSEKKMRSHFLRRTNTCTRPTSGTQTPSTR
jgi:hypothetical protein